MLLPLAAALLSSPLTPSPARAGVFGPDGPQDDFLVLADADYRLGEITRGLRSKDGVCDVPCAALLTAEPAEPDAPPELGPPKLLSDRPLLSHEKEERAQVPLPRCLAVPSATRLCRGGVEARGREERGIRAHVRAHTQLTAGKERERETRTALRGR